MDDGEIELSDHVRRPNSDSSSNFRASLPSDYSFLDDFLRNSQTCTHTHTCNPPGPEAAHTHTCYHTHTHLIPSEDNGNERSPISKPRRTPGNREAVRKYREKKKAHAAYLEEEVKKLRRMNQILMGKLQRQSILEMEISRLRALLFGLRGKIDDELREFPSQRECNSTNRFKEGECGFQHTSVNSLGNCQPPSISCEANLNIESDKKFLQGSMETLLSSTPQDGE